MTDATSWADYEWEIVHDPAVPPRLHLALDEVLATRVGEGRRKPTLRFWEWDESAVVIGSFQSVKNEVDPEGAEKYGFDVVRRISGGGAMMMEKGNVVTYSLYVPAELVQGMSFADSYAFLDDWVLQGAARASASRRRYQPLNDIASPAGKIGGAAQKRLGAGAVLHHVTMAYDLDNEKMLEVLRIGREKISDKGIASAAKRVDPLRSQTGLPRADDHRAPEADLHVALRRDARHGDGRRDGRGRRARRVEVRDERVAPPRALTDPLRKRGDWNAQRSSVQSPGGLVDVAAHRRARARLRVGRGAARLDRPLRQDQARWRRWRRHDDRRRGVRPRKHEAQVELDRQSRLPVPAPVPGDGDKGIAFADEEEPADVPARADRFKGSIRLDVER